VAWLGPAGRPTALCPALCCHPAARPPLAAAATPGVAMVVTAPTRGERSPIGGGGG